MHTAIRRQGQQGAVVVTVCLMLLFLLGFMGIAMDFGRLFIVKGELQTAMDSCALAAAQELDRQSSAMSRAQRAGLTASNLNRVNLQSPDWSGAGQLVDAEISFRDANYVPTSDPGAAIYAQCEHVQPGVRMWLLHILGTFSGNTGTFPETRDVFAQAVATRGSAQSTCPVPLALKPKAGGIAPDYGFIPGEWITLLMGAGTAGNGQIGWANLDGSNSASQTEAELNGHCGTELGDTLGTPGVQASVVDVWNHRFGIYKNTGHPSVHTPDFTGYAYTLSNWPSGFNAYSGTAGAGGHPTAASFVVKRASFASCADTRTRVRGANSCESITGLSMNSFTRLATPGLPPGGHRQYGTSRRIVTVPVVNTAMQVIDYACMLMLQPLSIPMAPVQLEFIGNASAASSPCTTSGLPGGSSGPLVPVLVR